MSVTKESFLSNVSEHELTIVLDTPTHKHIKLSKPQSSDRHYHLVTWPGYLSFSGDMGLFGSKECGWDNGWEMVGY